MPRKRRPTYAEQGPGAPTEAPPNMQAPSAPTGMPYGEHQNLIEAQQAMPLPNNDPLQQIAAAVAGGGLDFNSTPNLDADSDFPDEPITAGLPMGPGPGPEVLGQVDAGRVQSTLELIADLTGDPRMSQLAQFAALRRK